MIDWKKNWFVTGRNRYIILVGLDHLAEQVRTSMERTYVGGHGAGRNLVLACLDGQPGRITETLNAWRVDFTPGPGAEPVAVLDSHWKTLPSQQVSNGAGLWRTLVTPALAREWLARGPHERAPKRVAILQAVIDCAACGMTPRQASAAGKINQFGKLI